MGKARNKISLFKEILTIPVIFLEMRALFKLKCGNLEEGNKYWVEEHTRKCIFCGKGKDNLKYYVEECSEIRERFTKLGKDKEEILRKLYMMRS